MTDLDDEYTMRVALNHARRGLGRTAPNPSVGCVIVKNGRIIGAAHTGDGGRPHAETLALAQAGEAARGSCVVVTLEPCAHVGQTPSCAQALIHAGVARVVVACIDPDPRVSGRGLALLKGAGIDVSCGVLESQARDLNKGFISKVTKNRPLVTCKLAVSADRKISAAAGARTQISGALAMRYAHLERDRHDAIMVGVGTVLADNPLLTTRLWTHNKVKVRIILDENLRISLDSSLVQTASHDPLWVFHDSQDLEKMRALDAAGVKLFKVNPHDVRAVLNVLAQEGITRLLVEGGAQVHESFLKAGLVDRFALIKSPVILGEKGVFAPYVDDISKWSGLNLEQKRVLGEDVLEIYA